MRERQKVQRISLLNVNENHYILHFSRLQLKTLMIYLSKENLPSYSDCIKTVYITPKHAL